MWIHGIHVTSAVALVFLVAGPTAPAGATWSIVAVDPDNGAVGFAAASCTADVGEIGALVPGRGAVVAQAMGNRQGRDRAAELLAVGAHPEAILDAITAADFDRSHAWSWWSGARVRQYGVASLASGPVVASFTGDRTVSWSGDASSRGVAVQGNLLRRGDVVDDALAAFVAREGCALADRLLAALEAGARAGGDRRCSEELTALSAHLAVARPEDPPGSPSLSLSATFRDEQVGVLPSLWHMLFPIAGSGDDNPVAGVRARYDAWRADHPDAAGPCPAATASAR